MKRKEAVNHPLLLILVLTLITRLVFAFHYHEIWWDSGVYIGMGKYIFSGGESGLFEHIRPPFVPLVFGALWKVGLDPILFGRFFEIALMVGIVFLTYVLSRSWFDERTAILSSLIVSLSPIFFYLSFHQYTEIPSTFFVLLALYLAMRKLPVFAGVFLGFAFLSKFPAGMFLAVVLVYNLYRREMRDALYICAGFGVIVSPYFIWSFFIYGSFFATMTAARDAIGQALGCNVIRYKPWYQYLSWLIFSETKLHAFALVGMVALLFGKKRPMLFVLSLVLPLIYLSHLHCRDYRYLSLFLPFFAILTAYGVISAFGKLVRKRAVVSMIIIILGVWMFQTMILFYLGNEQQTPVAIDEEYFHYLDNVVPRGEVWVANPIIAAHTDLPLKKLYYPIYNETVADDFRSYLSLNKEKIGAVLLDNCGGGIICPPGESECEARTEQIIAELDSSMERVFDKQHGRCWYRIWMKPTS